MANRVLLGNRATGGHGLYVSKSGQNVLTCADNQLLFDSRKSRTGQIYAGAIGINFVRSSGSVNPSVIGTTNVFFQALSNAGNLTGKKIIIDGTTVTLSTTTTISGQTFTSADNIKTDINAANITNITANIRTISTGNQRLRIVKNSTTNALVISYPSSNSLEATVGISPETYQVGKLDSSGINWITGSGTTKASLGFVPLILFTERNMGEIDSEASDGDIFSLVSNSSLFESTQTHCIPVSAQASQPNDAGTGSGQNNAAVFSQETPSAGRFYDGDADEEDYECKNATFYVLRIPCAYGYMNNTYFG